MCARCGPPEPEKHPSTALLGGRSLHTRLCYGVRLSCAAWHTTSSLLTRVQQAAAARERHRQHPKWPLVTCGPWVSRLVAHVRLEFRAGACTRLHGPTSDPPLSGDARERKTSPSVLHVRFSVRWGKLFVLGIRLTLASHGGLDVGDSACYTPTPQRGDGSSGKWLSERRRSGRYPLEPHRAVDGG